MRISLTLFCVLLFVSGYAQKKQPSAPAAKKPLHHGVYDSWKEITYRSLTNDGSAAAFTVNPQDGDGKIIFYNLKTNTQDSVKRAADVNLTWDSQLAIFKIKPQQKLVKDLRRQKKKKEDLPKDSLGIYSFATRKTEKIPEVKSYSIPQKSGGWVAYQLEAKKEEKAKPADKKEKTDSTKKTVTPVKSKKIKKNSDDNGYTLVLRKLNGNSVTSFGYVKEYTFAKFGQGLLFSSTGNDSSMKAGMYWYDLQTEKLQALYVGKSKHKMKGLAVSEDGTQTAFLVDTDTTKALIRHFALYHWKKGEAAATLLDAEHSMALPANWIVSEHYTPLFSKDGSRLFFGASPQPVVQDTTLLTEEIVNVEVWTGEDEYIYPQQNRQLDNEKKRSYLTMIDLANKSISPLARHDVPSIDLGDEGNANIALGETNKPYRKMTTWDVSAYSDLHVFDLKNNKQKIVATKIKGNANLSPKASYVYWFSLPDTAWFGYSVANEKTVKLTQGLKVRFADEEVDNPDFPGAYGSAGWTANDASFIVYDRYDLWALDPENRKAPVNLTKIGRNEKIVFRYVRLDLEERFIDPTKELLLSAFNETSKASGYYKLSLTDGKLTKLLMTDHRYTNVVKARHANTLLFSRQSFQEFPDVWTSDFNFASVKKISDANPQMKKYLWGTVEMVNWVSLDNIPLKGLLYKPENFDPKKKYPMMVYFYEKYTDDLHQHFAPAPIRSFINFSLYVSNGYIVFVPDVVYKIGYPGESAMNCIMPGVTSVLSKGFVDEKRIGIQGHSWGGYQIAYMITRTNLFRAAEAGAPVSNMISAYGGIRWETGLSRMFQYEHTQSRIGGTLWEKSMLYIENSPIFFADKVQTPLLMMHNDADGAVPWYQGIEYYMALRRLNKPVWMLNYNGQGHGLTQRQDRTDFAKRMMQYFDHYLKDAPMPEWMKRGVPAIEKGIKQGYSTDNN
jgi:dipeptidyl aminopeptidase/acylaminoacyl peptidase